MSTTSNHVPIRKGRFQRQRMEVEGKNRLASDNPLKRPRRNSYPYGDLGFCGERDFTAAHRSTVAL